MKRLRRLVMYVLCLGLLCSNAPNKKANDVEGNSTNEVISYKEISKYYYNLVADQVDVPSKTFDEFITYFYDEYNSSFSNYVNEFANKNGVELNINLLDSSSSSVQDYILSYETTDYNEELTSEILFKTQPVYKAFDYSNIKAGYIFVETITSLNTGHCGIISNINKQSVSHGSYIQTIEAVEPKVSFGFLDDWRMVEYGIYIYKPKVGDNSYGYSVDKLEKVIDYCQKQISDDYDFHPWTNREDKDKWYCSELIYTAFYLEANLDLSRRIKSDGTYIGLNDGGWGLFSHIMPNDIAMSCNTQEIPMINTFFGLMVNSKISNRWSIGVTNVTNSVLVIEYNQKMCFTDDAKTWTKLDDLYSYVIMPKETRYVGIDENYFATTIAVSYTSYYRNKKVRFVSYADNLNASNKSLSIHYEVIV